MGYSSLWFEMALTIDMQMRPFAASGEVYCSNCIIATLIVVNKCCNSPIITEALCRGRYMTKVQRVNE